MFWIVFTTYIYLQSYLKTSSQKLSHFLFFYRGQPPPNHNWWPKSILLNQSFKSVPCSSLLGLVPKLYGTILRPVACSFYHHLTSHSTKGGMEWNNVWMFLAYISGIHIGSEIYIRKAVRVKFIHGVEALCVLVLLNCEQVVKEVINFSFFSK